MDLKLVWKLLPLEVRAITCFNWIHQSEDNNERTEWNRHIVI